jgi:phosphatidylglycerol---prolipoprotein diacylglyceryl transferase
MIPQILHIGPFPINSFGLMIALAFFALIPRLALSFKHNGLNGALAERYVFTGGFVGFLGARLWYIAEGHPGTENLLDALFSTAGFTFYGGFLIGAVVLLVMAHRDRFPISSFVDSVGPALALGYAIGRIGCQLAGDGCYGIPTDSVVGMSYPEGVIPTPPGVTVFPTPVFESTAAILVALVLARIETMPAWRVPFARFGAYLVLMAVERFSVEFLRRNPSVLWSLSEAQVIAVAIFAAGLVLLAVHRCLPMSLREQRD